MDELPYKVQRIFNGLFAPEVNSPSPMSGDFNPADIARQNQAPSADELIQGLLKPQTTASDRLNEMMMNQPNREDYKPSFWRKLGGGLISIDDERAGDQFTNRGFNNAMTDWNAKLKPVSELATVEKNQNANNRQIGTALLRDQNTDRAQAEKERANRANEDLKQQRMDEMWAYKAFQEEKYRNPAGKILANSDGYLVSVNPVTGETKLLADNEGKPIKSDKLPEAQKIEVNQNNELARIGARGNEARKTAGVTGEESRKTAGVKGEIEKDVDNSKTGNRIKVKETTPGKNTAPVVKPDDERVPVIDKNGNPGTVPKSQLEAAKAQGFKEVGKKQELTGVGLNLKPVVKKTGF